MSTLVSCQLFCFRFHLNESDKFALFGSKMPSASGGLRPPGPRWGHHPQTPALAIFLAFPFFFLQQTTPGYIWDRRGQLKGRSGPRGSARVRVVEFSYNFVHGTNAGNHYATPPTGGLKRAFGGGIVSPTSPSRRNLIPVTARVVNTHLGDLICVISPYCGVNQSTT